MDIEQVKLIIDLIKDLGVQGKEGLIWWLIIKEVLPLIAWSAFGFTTITFAYRLLYSVSYGAPLLALRKKLFPHLSGYLTESEVNDIIQEVSRLKDSVK